ncbi:Zinc finger, RING-type domain and Zinc finger, RING/FYVE/PHD-type domain-containing protein [Strongyloides ratti]|uniref:RING-type E3 ubiquitin transferase n=1 Tax=Strongyloides ratti TaxID=34506 RepID=A0A090LJX1_STRRB|nr:Zinc finger, RING-type domain and Zinc finger, RING/FYVE/PHD-type domain-containing protein [Strongyloides ratti]CEF68433.1 Zinc finger, RING-type domain and Zinc finger, RING/FYVE/PHD-type domain-containing protein [Strongyloides ratti]
MDNIYYCHHCREPVSLSATDIVCSKCNGGFVEPLQDYYANNPNGPRGIPLFTQNIPSGSGIRNATAIFGFPTNGSSFGFGTAHLSTSGVNGEPSGSNNSGSTSTNRNDNLSFTDILNVLQRNYGQNVTRNNRGSTNNTTTPGTDSEVHQDNENTTNTHQSDVSSEQNTEGTNPRTTNNSNGQPNSEQNNSNVLVNFIDSIIRRIIPAPRFNININNSEIPTPPNTTNNSEASTTNVTNANNSPNHQERNDGEQNQQQQRTTRFADLLGQLNNAFNRRNQQNLSDSETTANVSVSQSNNNHENNDNSLSGTTEGRENTEDENRRDEQDGTGRRPEIGQLFIRFQENTNGIVLNVTPDDVNVSLSTEDLINDLTEALRNATSTGGENLTTEINTATFQNVLRDITRLMSDPQSGNVLNVSRNGITLGIAPNENVFEGILRIVENIDEVANARRNRLSDVEIARIPIVEVTEEQEKNESQCTVCMDIFVKNELVYKLACKHIFHKQCLNPWVQSHRSCPVCRQEIKPYDFPDVEAEENYTDDMELD